MKSFRPKPLVSLALSLLLIVALLINVGLTPVHASTPQNSVGPTDCPDSLVVMASQEARILLGQVGIFIEDGDANSDDSQTERAKSQDENSVQAEKPVEDKSLPTSSSNEDSLLDDEATAPDATSSSPAEPREPQDFWGSLRDFWNQIRELRISMPELTFEEAREVWGQIRELRVEIPDLTFEEAKEVWSQLRKLRIEMPDLSLEEARAIWNQIRELQIELPDLSFEEARQVWNQIRELQIESPELSFEEARQVWRQIQELQVELPALNFEEARQVWSQIRELQIELPDLTFREAQEVWWGQVQELQMETPDLNFEEARQVWSQIRDLRKGIPDFSPEEAREFWSQIQELRVEMPDLSIEEAKEVWSQIRELRIETPDLSFGAAQEVWWGQIREIQMETPDLNFEEARRVWSQLQELRVEMRGLSFGEAREVWWSQIRDLQIEMPNLSLEEAKEAWSQIRELQLVIPTLSFEQAKDFWREILELWKVLPDLSFEEVQQLWLGGLARHFEEGARKLLMEQGFEDTDGDGELNWPPDSPFSGKNVDVELIIGGTGGLVIGIVPGVGDAVDVAALTVGRDPFTGECLTLTEQVLLAVAVISFLPISVRTVKIIGKQLDSFQPVFRKFLVNSIPERPISIRRWLISDLVDPKYKNLRVVAGEGETTTVELANKTGFDSFGNHNYREALMEFTGVSEEAASGFDAHHILPKAFEQQFLESGIDSIHDPRLLVWVDKMEHQSWSPSYTVSWVRFFEQHQNPTKLQILEEAQRLSDEVGYRVLFRVSP